jgi:proteic killer suppression protein
MIVSFACKDAELLFGRERPKRLPKRLHGVAYRKLVMLHAATELADLRIPPNNRLEKLKGDRKGSYSIRINDQWRICFCWEDGRASEVEIVDYH